MKGFALAGIKSGWLHTISEKEEGYIMISEPTSKVCFGGLKDLILGTVKGMGLKGSIQFLKDESLWNIPRKQAERSPSRLRSNCV